MSVMDAIVRALHWEFGDWCEIYPEEVKQGLKEPCFLIETVQQSGGLYRGQRYRRNASFCIHYFPESDEPEEECRGVMESLFWLLECIPFGDGMIRGTEMHGKTEDSVLNFFVDYNCFLLRTQEEEKMEHVEIVTKGKGEDKC